MTSIAIIGRPNVGKSTLINTLSETKSVVTSTTPGTTRDIVELYSEWNGKKVRVIDTGGFSFDDQDSVQRYINTALEDAVAKSDIVFFVVDGSVNKTSTDLALAQKLKKSDKPVYLIVNKIDSYQKELNAYQYKTLGFQDTYYLSAVSGYGVGDMLDEVFMKADDDIEEESSDVRFAFFGKPNVGKSSLFNALIEQDRVLTSSEAGTTVDQIEFTVPHKSKKLTLVDTAGIRKRTKIKSGIERSARKKSLALMKRIDVACLVINADDHIAKQDQRIARDLADTFIPTIIIVNKLDLISPLDDHKNVTQVTRIKIRQIEEKLSPLYFASIVFVSAKDSFHLTELKNKILRVWEDYHRDITQDDLDDFLQSFLLKYPPRSKRHLNPPKIKGLVQLQKQPDVFALNVSVKGYLNESYVLNMQRRLQEYLKRDSVPIRLIVRKGNK